MKKQFSLDTFVRRKYMILTLTLTLVTVGVVALFHMGAQIYLSSFLEKTALSQTSAILSHHSDYALERQQEESFFLLSLLERVSELRKTYPDFSLEVLSSLGTAQLSSTRWHSLLKRNPHLYRISPEGLVVESTFPKDLGLDLSQHPRFWKKLLSLKTGESIVAEPIPSSAEGILTRYVYRKAKDGSLLQASLKTEHFYLTETVEILNNLPLVRKIALYHYPTLFPATKEMPPLTEKQKIFLEPLLTGKKSLLPPERGLPGISKNLSRNFSRAGELIVSIPENSPYAAFSDKSLRVMEAFGNVLAAFFGMDGFIKSQELFQKELLMTITGILETHDAYTQGHSESVALLGGQIARALDLPERQVQQTYWAGLVHDIGKILIPKEILNKPSSLTPEEYALIQEHPALGYAMLNKAERLQEIAPFVLHHHERWDGKGYPQGLGKEEIPEISRILAVADTWDAMTSNRSYRQALPEDVARKEILRGKGTQFDPRMVDLFFSVLGDFPKKA